MELSIGDAATPLHVYSPIKQWNKTSQIAGALMVNATR